MNWKVFCFFGLFSFLNYCLWITINILISSLYTLVSLMVKFLYLKLNKLMEDAMVHWIDLLAMKPASHPECLVHVTEPLPPI